MRSFLHLSIEHPPEKYQAEIVSENASVRSSSSLSSVVLPMPIRTHPSLKIHPGDHPVAKKNTIVVAQPLLISSFRANHRCLDC